eukprot:GFUD01032397.1.p1 GENE.GFUD01032397.1~~GFUD01032397.1.p1  ORF type:complete len:132 (+),score=6.63 GFUD01032397.1:1119-1514(+)
MYSVSFTLSTGWNFVFLFECSQHSQHSQQPPVHSHKLPSRRPEHRPSTESPQHTGDHSCTVTQVHRSAVRVAFCPHVFLRFLTIHGFIFQNIEVSDSTLTALDNQKEINHFKISIFSKLSPFIAKCSKFMM